MDIVEFLEARIAEDEAAARLSSRHNDPGVTFTNDDFGHLLVGPERILRECEAKRAIIDDYKRFRAEQRRMMNGWITKKESPIALALAAIWSDHPDFDLEWTA